MRTTGRHCHVIRQATSLSPFRSAAWPHQHASNLTEPIPSISLTCKNLLDTHPFLREPPLEVSSVSYAASVLISVLADAMNEREQPAHTHHHSISHCQLPGMCPKCRQRLSSRLASCESISPISQSLRQTLGLYTSTLHTHSSIQLRMASLSPIPQLLSRRRPVRRQTELRHRSPLLATAVSMIDVSSIEDTMTCWLYGHVPPLCMTSLLHTSSVITASACWLLSMGSPSFSTGVLLHASGVIAASACWLPWTSHSAHAVSEQGMVTTAWWLHRSHSRRHTLATSLLGLHPARRGIPALACWLPWATYPELPSSDRCMVAPARDISACWPSGLVLPLSTGDLLHASGVIAASACWLSWNSPVAQAISERSMVTETCWLHRAHNTPSRECMNVSACWPYRHVLSRDILALLPESMGIRASACWLLWTPCSESTWAGHCMATTACWQHKPTHHKCHQGSSQAMHVLRWRQTELKHPLDVHTARQQQQQGRSMQLTLMHLLTLASLCDGSTWQVFSVFLIRNPLCCKCTGLCHTIHSLLHFGPPNRPHQTRERE